MRIRTLRLRDFRRYRDLRVEFAPGLTIVRGPNEAGQSTIQRGIELAITRRVTSAASDLESLRPWDAPADARSIIDLEFDQDEEDGRKTGTVEKTFAGSKGTVQLDYDGQSVTDPALADQILAELTGIPSEAFFRSTASVRHQELADLARDESALRDRLQASISGADRGTSVAKKKLEKALHDLTTKGEKNPGRLKVAETAVAQAAAALDQGESALTQLGNDRDALSSALDRRGQAEISLTERQAMLEKARQAERLTVERDTAQERYDRFRQAVEVNDERTKLAAEHPSPHPLPVIRATVERLRQLQSRERELRAMLAGDQTVSFEVAPEPTWRPLSRLGVVLVIVGLLVAGGSFALETLKIVDLGIVPRLLGGVVGAIGVILAAVALWLRRSYSMGTQMRDVEIDRRLRGRSEIEAELASVEAETTKRLGQLSLDDLPAAEALLTKEEAHVAALATLTARLEGLVGKEPAETLASQRDTAALDVAQRTSALDALGPIAKEPRARERLEVEVRDQGSALERARDDESNARARVEANVVDAEQVAGQAERLATWREQLDALQRRNRVYETTLRAIEEAEKATMRTATRYLERRMLIDLGSATAGRYRYVRVDDKTLDIEVRAPEKKDWVKVSALSQGTLDLVYLTARLGLVRLVTGDRRPPLIFDDPFVTLDDARAGRALDLLKGITTDFQVIYLTTSERYDGAADKVVVLPGPTAVDDAAAPVETGS